MDTGQLEEEVHAASRSGDGRHRDRESRGGERHKTAGETGHIDKTQKVLRRLPLEEKEECTLAFLQSLPRCSRLMCVCVWGCGDGTNPPASTERLSSRLRNSKQPKHPARF